jgi:hypothetical protein
VPWREPSGEGSSAWKVLPCFERRTSPAPSVLVSKVAEHLSGNGPSPRSLRYFTVALSLGRGQTASRFSWG